jgi:hypothetical protein
VHEILQGEKGIRRAHVPSSAAGDVRHVIGGPPIGSATLARGDLIGIELALSTDDRSSGSVERGCCGRADHALAGEEEERQLADEALNAVKL